jgi:arylformamidase
MTDLAQMAAARPIDVSVTVRPEMPIYAGNPGVAVELTKSIARGDPANVSYLKLGAHTGTHVDAPRHFIPEAEAASELSLEPLIGPCAVVDATAQSGPLGRAAVASLDIPAGVERVLLKTSNSALWERDTFESSFVRLDAEGANELVDRRIRLVGIDYLSVGDPDAHLVLFRAGVGVIEGLDLRGVDHGDYFLVCLPLKIAGSDGAPARALLWPAISTVLEPALRTFA